MRLRGAFLLGLAPLALALGQAKPVGTITAPLPVPAYTADGHLLARTDYREWIFLSSDMDMSYNPPAPMAEGDSMFGNVFVNPQAYRAFLETGTWPDKTMMALEFRGAKTHGSINKSGHFQGTDTMGVEMHVKDEARGGWAFYEFNGDAPATMVPRTASCYSCHHDHAAVDTTFVQFYPTLLPLAKQKGTLSSNYLKDEAKQ